MAESGDRDVWSGPPRKAGQSVGPIAEAGPAVASRHPLTAAVAPSTAVTLRRTCLAERAIRFIPSAGHSRHSDRARRWSSPRRQRSFPLRLAESQHYATTAGGTRRNRRVCRGKRWPSDRSERHDVRHGIEFPAVLRGRVVTGGSQQLIAIALAVTAAGTFAVANVVQQRVAARLRTDAAFEPTVLLRLIRRPLWLAGLVLVIVSLSLQATALDLGRLVVIEPVLACSLLFALALAAWADHRRMRTVEWLAALATFAGLAVFLSVAHPSGGYATATSGELGLAAIAAVMICVVAGVLAVRMSPLRRALTLGIGGGVAAGVTDALTKTTAALIGSHQLGALADVRLYLLAVIGLLTYTMQQNGYRAAALAAFLPVFSVLDPAVGSLLGLTLYHEHLAGGAGRIALEGAAVLSATWGIATLAKSTAQAKPAVAAELAAHAIPAAVHVAVQQTPPAQSAGI